MADAPPTSLRQRALRRKASLWTERSSWEPHWRDISEYQQPRLGRFVASDRNKGDKKSQTKVIDSTALFASRTLAAGLMSGVTSPARPWFRLAIADRDLMEAGAVKQWLHDCAQVLRRVFAVSNTYRALHMMYEELGLFGTAASVVVDNYERVIHLHTMTIGEYALGLGEDGNVNTLAREFELTVGQLVERFGIERCSQSVQSMYRNGNVDKGVAVLHLVEPRHLSERRAGRLDPASKAFRSLYLETGAEEGAVLRESGFDRFPVLAPRWIVTGNDTYGRSPGMDALGDVKQLQHQQMRKATAIDYQVNPPLQVPTRYHEASKARLPGGVFYVDSAGPNTGVRSAFEVNLNLQHLLIDIQDVRERIRQAYYADLFLMISNIERTGVTATEIAQKQEEKLLMLGPVLERLHNEMLEPLIDLAFDKALQAGLLPRPPPELEGMPVEVEFISVLAQAQRAVATSGIDRLVMATAQMAQLRPDVLDKLNLDQAVDDYAEAYGVNPELVVPDDQVAAMRAERAQAMAAQQAAAAMPVMADTAKTVGDINGDNLRDVMGSLQGYQTPSAQFV